jgi:hypothetical protein
MQFVGGLGEGRCRDVRLLLCVCVGGIYGSIYGSRVCMAPVARLLKGLLCTASPPPPPPPPLPPPPPPPPHPPTSSQVLLNSTAIDRKLVKQTVMTSVYGVTFVGARGQIGARLKERGFQNDDTMYRVSCYAAKVSRWGWGGGGPV